jgi:hypothetical protein
LAPLSRVVVCRERWRWLEAAGALDGTDRSDAAWFIRIADQGYRTDDPSAAFYPGYPLVVHGVAWLLPIGFVGSALLVSNLSFLAALLVLYSLTSFEFSERMVRRTVVLAACFPISFFLLAPYSESRFLLASLPCFWWARHERWMLAGLAGLSLGRPATLGSSSPKPADRDHAKDNATRRTRNVSSEPCFRSSADRLRRLFGCIEPVMRFSPFTCRRPGTANSASL